MTNYQFIKEFQNIKLSKICKKYNITLSNLVSGQTTEENYRKVKEEIVEELLAMLIRDKGEEILTLYLYDDILLKIEKENRALRELI